MSAFLGTEVVPGTVPAWALVFSGGREQRTIGSDTYVGSVSATLPVGLAGGAYEIVIEGMTSEDYQRINSLAAAAPLSASLHMWWKDAPTGVLGGLAKFTGLDNPLSATTPEPPAGSLVAELRVDRLARRPGPRRVDVVVTGRELVVAALSERLVDGRCTETLLQAVKQVAGGVVPVIDHRLDKAERRPDQKDFVVIPAGSALHAMETTTGQVQAALGLYGLQIAMIRDGGLHVGEWTATAPMPPLDVGRSLDDASGLLAIERGADLPRDARVPAGQFGKRSPRRTFAVTALGRPDLKPGDRVSLVLPPEDFTIAEPPSIGATLLTSVPNLPFGAADPGAQPSVCRIVELSHTISREKGFLTTFRAVVLNGADDGWDRVERGTTARDVSPRRQAGVPFADSAHGAASTINTLVADLTSRAQGAVRARPAVIHDHSHSPGVPRHSSDVWHSDAAPDGRPRAAQRTEITAAAHAELNQVPYVTPFAWGGFGMVLPRYPGTRVVLANVGGGPGDFVDVGALWPVGGGPAARPGDYWLALPVGITEREHLRDPDKQLPDDGPATHDLIDGDGTRVIETARFVLRVTDTLTKVPDRPAPDDDLGAGSVLIESRTGQGGARIVLSDDGSVTITAKSITFDTEGQGDIELKAKNVNVTLDGGTMDVS